MKNPKSFYSKPDLLTIGKRLGDIDAFSHWGGHYLLIEFKRYICFSEKDEAQIRSQLCLALETNATYWIVKWYLTADGRTEVSELLEVKPNGKIYKTKIDAKGVKAMYEAWWKKAKRKTSLNSKWDDTEEIFYRLKNRMFDDPQDGMAAIH
ncbi:hypothetical protein EKA14_26485 [Bacillus mycoides]|nr:hypothetical protein EKA14_26485 [Bacillus mycoides]